MKRINEGYEIIESVQIYDRTEIVIGHAVNPSRPSQFVCWDCTDGDNYMNGGYTFTYRQALAILAERITARYDYLSVDVPRKGEG